MTYKRQHKGASGTFWCVCIQLRTERFGPFFVFGVFFPYCEMTSSYWGWGLPIPCVIPHNIRAVARKQKGRTAGHFMPGGKPWGLIIPQGLLLL